MSADPIRRELERLRLANGGLLLAGAVVEAARSPESPLHHEFDWDDARAAGQHRLAQAEALIRRYRVVTVATATERRTYRREEGPPQYVPHPHTGQGYGRTQDLLGGPERQAVLLQEMARLQGHVRRYCLLLREAGHPALAEKLQECLHDMREQLSTPAASAAG